MQLKWHDPKATVVEGLVSRGDRRLGPVIEDVWRHGGTFQEWSEFFDLDLWIDALERHGLGLDWYVYRHRTEDEVLPWDHLSAGLHKDFLWQDWRDALAEVGLQDCRWTPCYDCGACTGYGIEHVVASAVPPAGGSQGTGQDLSTGGAVPVDPAATPAGDRGRRVEPSRRSRGTCRDAGSALRFSKTGKVRFTSHRDVARIWERALRRAELAGGLLRGLLAPPQAALRPGAVDRSRVARRVPRHRPRSTGSTVDVAGLPERLTPALPVGIEVHDRGGRSSPGPNRSRQARDHLLVVGRGRRRHPSTSSSDAVDRALAADEIVVTRQRKGSDVTDDLRPYLTRPLASPVPPTTGRAGSKPSSATQPRSLRPAELARRTGRRLDRGSGLPNPPMDRARQRPP